MINPRWAQPVTWILPYFLSSGVAGNRWRIKHPSMETQEILLFCWSHFSGFELLFENSRESSARIWAPLTLSNLPFARDTGRDRGTRHSRWIEQPCIPRQSFSHFPSLTRLPGTLLGSPGTFSLKSVPETWNQLESPRKPPFSALVSSLWFRLF